MTYAPGQYPPPYGYPQPYGSPQVYPLPYASAPPPGSRRPALATAAAVLGYINAGMLVLAGALLLFGASIVSDLENGFATNHDISTELALDGLVNLVAAGLLIAGAVLFTGRRANGRTMFVLGSVVVLVEAIYWLVRFDSNRLDTDPYIVWAIIFATLAVLSLAFSFTAEINKWLRGGEQA